MIDLYTELDVAVDNGSVTPGRGVMITLLRNGEGRMVSAHCIIAPRHRVNAFIMAQTKDILRDRVELKWKNGA